VTLVAGYAISDRVYRGLVASAVAGICRSSGSSGRLILLAAKLGLGVPRIAV